MERGRRNESAVKRKRTCTTGGIFSIAIDIGQANAFIEGIVADAGHALWDGDGGQAAAIIEGTAADAGHVIANNIFFNLIPKDCVHR